MSDLILGVTGRRNLAVDFVDERLLDLAILSLDNLKPKKVITGMALGWDTAVCYAAYLCSTPYICAIPFLNQESPWKDTYKKRYKFLLENSESNVIVSEGGYSHNKLQKRNEWIVDNSDKILTLWEGDKRGGTYNCIKYANKKNKQIINIWNQFERTIDEKENLPWVSY
jgi:uncharacterized phage-like protein YoqJ